MLRGVGMGWTKKGGLCAAAGLLIAITFLVLDRTLSLATIVGARPLLMAVGLGLAAALVLEAALARQVSRSPTLATPVPILLRMLAWWCGVSLALAMVAFASWKQWGIVCLFLAIAAMIKAVTVFTYVKRDYRFRIWLPFAAILGLFIFIQAVLLFLGRPDVPPPIVAVLDAYNVAPAAPDASSRTAPDLSRAGFTLVFKGDLDLGGLPATLFSYRSNDGGPRVDLYLTKISFPRPSGSTNTTDPSGWWARQENLFLRAGSAPTHFMIASSSQLSEDTFAHAYSFTGADPGTGP